MSSLPHLEVNATQAMNEQPDLPGVASVAELEAKLLADILAELRALPSGVGGENQNAWCDLVGNVQEGDEDFFDILYRDTVLGILAVLIRRLSQPERERLWLLTERGQDYDFEMRWQEGDDTPDLDELAKLRRTSSEQIEDIARGLRNGLYEIAARADLARESKQAARGGR